MKRLLFTLVLLLMPLLARAQQQIPSTAFTRALLRSPDAPTTRSTLGLNATTNVGFAQVVFTNTFRFSTNAFPLSPGTVWDWSVYEQNIVTNADFNVSALAGLTNNALNVAELNISNSSASTIICHLLFAGNKFGASTTNDIYIGAGKEACVNGEARGFQRTNYVTLTEQ